MILYKKTRRGIEQWEMELTNSNYVEAELTVRHGLLNGILTEKKTLIKGKNIGRSNATSPVDQARKEQEAEYKKMRERKGYYSLDDLEASRAIQLSSDYSLELWLEDHLPEGVTVNDYIQPMLAQKFYKKNSKKEPVLNCTFPCYGQPKLNGVRCTVEFIEGQGLSIMSREGVAYRVDHLTLSLLALIQDIKKYLPNTERIILDGELYIHGYILADIVSAIKKPNLNTALVEFRVFDLAIPNVTQQNRILALKTCFTEQGNCYNGVSRVPTILVSSLQEAEQFTTKWISEGYEGGIYRNPHAFYEFGKRTKSLIKHKKRESSEFLIYDVVDSRDNPGVGMFVCRNDINHETFTVVPEGTIEKRKEYLSNKFNCIGKMLTVEYYERTEKGIPFHATGIVIRDYE